MDAMAKTSDSDIITRTLYIDADERANRFNLMLLLLLFVCEAVCLALNELGIFTVERVFLRYCILAGAYFSLAPIIIWLAHDAVLRRRPSVCRKVWFKQVIILFTFLTVALFCSTISGHTVPLLAVPALVVAQYRSQRRQNLVVLGLTVVLVLLSVYAAYFFGSFNRDLHKGIADAEGASFAARIALATPKRMTELFTHHALPRLLAFIAVVVLCIGASRRNDPMLRRQVELAQSVQQEMQKRNAMQRSVIEDLAAVIESRDVSTGEHVARTKRYVQLIALEMQKDPRYSAVLTDETVDRIVRAAPLHDIGKIAVSDRILQKPGRLTPEEFEQMKLHAAKGGEMVHNILGNLDDEPFLETAADIATCHHERWDGGGYPAGLAGEAIPLPARMMSVADVFDALVSERCYKKAMPPEQAFRIIEEERGKQFDPAIVDLLPTLKPAFLAVLSGEEEH